MIQSDVSSILPITGSRRLRLATPPGRAGQWEPVQLAGEGTLARVYRARPEGAAGHRSAAYALKILRPEWEDDSRAVALVRREAIVGKTVSHPHVISILAAGVASPPYYVVMPWLTGSTLAGRAVRRKRPPLAMVFWIARQVGEALEGLHAAGWMHGDVKPSNIFVAPEGHVTLLDLGFARRVPACGCDRPDPGITRWLTGTYQYIAPEVLTAGLRVDVRSDIYSLGVVMYEMLAGRVPFRGRDPGELARQHRGARVPDLRRLVPDVPAEAAALVGEMVAKEPLRRPQTPRELVERLAAMEIATFARR
jgi:serine/threonine protein kinase